MLDTVEFRLHNLQQYPTLVNVFDNEEGKKTIKIKSKLANEWNGKMDLTTFVLDYDNKFAIPMRKADKIKIESSEHEVVYYIDPNRSILVINCSLPKVFFGNNVLELIPFDKQWSINNNDPFKQIEWYQKLLPKLFKHFIHLISRGLPVNKTDLITGEQVSYGIDLCDVEIFRIDITVNQIFNSKEDAMRYLNFQYNILKKHQTPYASSRRRYNTTVEVKTERYYAKIYHKGTEFHDVQRKKIRKHQREKKKGLHCKLASNSDLTAAKQEQLQDFADRILRYEFSFRAEYMSYIYNQRINKKWSKLWDEWRKNYFYLTEKPERMNFIRTKRVMYHYANGQDSWTRLATADGMPIPHTDVSYWKSNDENTDWIEYNEKEYAILRSLKRHLVTLNHKHLKQWCDFMERELNKVRRFTLRSEEVEMHRPTVVNPETGELFKIDVGIKTPTQQRFSYTLLKHLLIEAKDFFQQFQIYKLEDEAEFVNKLDQYTEQKKAEKIRAKFIAIPELSPVANIRTRDVKNPRGLYKASLIMFDKLLREGKSYDDIKANNYFSRSTYFELKKKYEEIMGCSGQLGKEGNIIVNRNFNEIWKELNQYSLFSEIGHFYLNANALVLPLE